MDMIPTRSRSKTPQGWSYPVGAEIISSAMEGVPHYDNIYLRFLWMNPSSHSTYKNRVYILGVGYDNPQYTMMKENWRIDINGVPSDMRSAVRQHLVEQSLPYARSWMTIQRPPLWHESAQYFSVYFDMDTDKFEREELNTA